ncbi:MAG: hypothetical protein AAGF20_00195 [Pseudomonadota bacterium]
MTTKKYTAHDIRAAFRKKYAQPEWASFFEVSNGTGMNGGERYADAVAMSLWPSRGLHLHGFEFKVARSDWTKELKDPAKAELLATRCHFWWVVTANDIVQDGEMPAGWGHIVLDGRGLRVTKKAPQREASDLTWQWLAAILRRAGQVTDGEIRRLVEAQDRKRAERFQERVRGEVDHRTRDLESVKKRIAEFEAATGISIDRWGEFDRFTQAAKILMQADLSDPFNGIKRMRDRLAMSVDKLDEAFGEISPSRMGPLSDAENAA